MWNKAVKPMLLSESDDIPKKDFIYELKYDGMRALIYVDSKNLKIFNRHEKDITYLFPELKEITKLVSKKCILDGEIICVKDGKPDFSKLQNRIHLKNNKKILSQSMWNRASFICFDILFYDKNVCLLPLCERKKLLETIDDNDIFVKSKIFYDGSKLFKSVKKFDLEGIVCKNVNSKYIVNSRSDEWIKVKNYKYEYFYIGAYSLSNSNVFSIYLGEYINKNFYYVGKVFVSKKYGLYEKLLECDRSENLFNNIDFEANFIKPSIKVKIRYIERTCNNHLREAFYISKNY